MNVGRGARKIHPRENSAAGVDGLYDNPKLTLVAELIYGTLERALEAALNYDVVDDIIALYRNRVRYDGNQCEANHPDVYTKQ